MGLVELSFMITKIIKSVYLPVFVFLVVLLIWSMARADDTTFNAYSQEGCGAQCSSGLYYKSLIVTLAAGGSSCSDKLVARRASELAKTDYAGGNCIGPLMTANTACNFGFMCICCDTDWVNSKGLREVGKGAAITVTNVDQGMEKTAAEAAFQTFDAGNPYADLTAEGYSRTDGFKGYAYTAALGQDGITENLAVTTWKRGAYTKGPAYSLESLGGGSGGEGLTKADAQDAFTSALTTKGLSNDNLKTSMKDALDYAHTQGYLDLSLTPENFPGLKAEDVAGTFTGGNTSGLAPSALTSDEQAGIKSSFVNAVQAPFSTFITDMKGTALFSGVSDFFAPGNISGGGPENIDIETNYFGSWTFDWSNYTGAFAILRVCMLVCFGYASVRIVMRGGAG